MSQYGQVIGSEEFGKGVNTLLGPTINIVRDPRWGRAFESLSEDPFLAAQLDAPEIQAIQAQGPIVQVKHYADYNQETFRNTPQDNVIMSDRTQREIYLPAFESAVQQGGANSVMCSYATVNGTDACENGLLLNTILKGQLGFTGFVGSDFGGTHSTVNAANNGLDQEMTGSTFFGDPLIAAVNAGQVSQATIDDHVRQILTAMFAQGLFDNPQTGTMGATVTSAAHQAVATQTAEEGSVLLKNSAVLPVAGSSSVAVIGDDAGANAMTAGGGSTHVNPSTLASVVTPVPGHQDTRRERQRHLRAGRRIARRVDRGHLVPEAVLGHRHRADRPILQQHHVLRDAGRDAERPERQLPVGAASRRCPACRARRGRPSGPARSPRRPPATSPST